MKLDTSHMRYLSKSDFRVLTAFEMGSKNHEIVPTKLVISISGIKNVSQVNRSISALAKIKLVAKQKNAKYDGYKLTYHGYDYLALKAMVSRESIYAVGTQVGIGKESDIFSVADAQGKTLCLKVHRLGRISFRSVKNNRDYMGKRQHASWSYLSRLAAEKEFTFMKVLYDAGFSVPVPVDQSRHHVVMSMIEGLPLRKLREHEDPARLYKLFMDFALRLANQGLIHCDFNEFNLLVQPFDPASPETEIVVIDFPQCVSIDHPDAKMFFERDIDSIRAFFRTKFDYSGEYPKWSQVKREGKLDLAAGASGTDKKGMRDLEKHLAQLSLVQEGDQEFDEDSEDEEDSEEQDALEEDEEESESEQESEQEEESAEESEPEPEVLEIASLNPKLE